MKIWDNIRVNPDDYPRQAQAIIDCIESIPHIWARQLQAERIASLTDVEANRLIVLRRQGMGAYEAVDLILKERDE